MKEHICRRSMGRSGKIYPYLSLESESRDVDIKFEDIVTGTIEGKSPYIHAELKRCFLTKNGMNWVFRNLVPNHTEAPAILQQAEFIDFNGEVIGNYDNLQALGVLKSEAGEIKAHVKLNKTPQGVLQYDGTIQSEKLNLKQLLNEQQLGDITFDLHLAGRQEENIKPSIHIDGSVTALEYSNYLYQNIEMNGTFNDKGFNGLLSLQDPNLSLRLNGEFNIAEAIPTFNLTADIDHFRPQKLQLSDKYEGCEYSMSLNACFSGNNIDNINGDIHIDSLAVIVPEDYFYMEHFHLQARTQTTGEKHIAIRSDFMKADIEGEYAYQTLPESFVSILNQYIPSLLRQ